MLKFGSGLFQIFFKIYSAAFYFPCPSLGGFRRLSGQALAEGVHGPVAFLENNGVRDKHRTTLLQNGARAKQFVLGMHR